VVALGRLPNPVRMAAALANDRTRPPQLHYGRRHRRCASARSMAPAGPAVRRGWLSGCAAAGAGRGKG